MRVVDEFGQIYEIPTDLLAALRAGRNPLSGQSNSKKIELHVHVHVHNELGSVDSYDGSSGTSSVAPFGTSSVAPFGTSSVAPFEKRTDKPTRSSHRR